jgi:hypothetical protein
MVRSVGHFVSDKPHGAEAINGKLLSIVLFEKPLLLLEYVARGERQGKGINGKVVKTLVITYPFLVI